MKRISCLKQAEVKLLNAAEEVMKRFSDTFDRSLGTFYVKVEPNAVPVIIPGGEFQQHF